MSATERPETDAEKLTRRNRELSILNAIAAALNRSVDMDEALQTALAQVASLLGLQTGWIWLLSEPHGEGGGEPYLAASQNLPPALSRCPERMEGRCYCLDSFQAGDMDGAANVDVITCSRLKGIVDGTDGLRYHASVPLAAHEKRLGVLNLASTDWQGLSADDLRLLHTVGDLLGIAIERARLFAAAGRLGAAEERNRLAREIHDTLAQGLAGVALQIETADALLEAKGDDEATRGHEPEARAALAAPVPRARQALARALALTRASLEDARRSVLDLRAAPLEGRCLAEALAALVAAADGAGPRVNFTVVGAHAPLSPRLEAGLYRIAQEALANALHHSGATTIRLTLEVTPEQIHLRVEDDGQGFDPDAIPDDRFGLVGLNERVRLMGGRLHLQTEPGAGVRLEVEVPVGGRS